MKSKSFVIIDEFVRSNAIIEINKIECDGKTRVVISDAKGKRSEKINRLMWLWYSEIQVFLREHLGQIHSTDDIHEYMVNLLLPRKVVEINGISKTIRAHTSKMNNKEMSDYLELLEHYCGSELGLSLTHPIDLYLEATK